MTELTTAVQQLTEPMPNFITVENHQVRVVAASCGCGGSHAWVRLHDTGAEEMLGCVCHTLPSGIRMRS